MSNVDKWDYSQVVTPTRYGDDTTYIRGMEWLAVCPTIEDWGCGTTYARKFCNPLSTYKGVDGSASKFCDEVADLVGYKSACSGIFMRHVIEHNLEWREILRNAVASFTRRMALIIHTPWQASTDVIQFWPGGYLDVGFGRDDVEELLVGCRWSIEEFKTPTTYGVEYVMRVEKL